VKLCQFVDILYPHMLINFRQFILILNKMALLFLGVLLIFYRLSFEFQQVKLSWLHRHWYVAQFTQPQSTALWGLKGNAMEGKGVLIQAVTEVKNSSRALECTLVNLVCLTGDNHW